MFPRHLGEPTILTKCIEQRRPLTLPHRSHSTASAAESCHNATELTSAMSVSRCPLRRYSTVTDVFCRTKEYARFPDVQLLPASQGLCYRCLLADWHVVDCKVTAGDCEWAAGITAATMCVKTRLHGSTAATLLCIPCMGECTRQVWNHVRPHAACGCQEGLLVALILTVLECLSYSLTLPNAGQLV